MSIQWNPRQCMWCGAIIDHRVTLRDMVHWITLPAGNAQLSRTYMGAEVLCSACIAKVRANGRDTMDDEWIAIADARKHGHITIILTEREPRKTCIARFLEECAMIETCAIISTFKDIAQFEPEAQSDIMQVMKAYGVVNSEVRNCMSVCCKSRKDLIVRMLDAIDGDNVRTKMIACAKLRGEWSVSADMIMPVRVEGSRVTFEWHYRHAGDRGNVFAHIDAESGKKQKVREFFDVA